METKADAKISRKARLYASVPVNELVKRGWIETSTDIDVLEDRVLHFLDRESLDEPSRLMYASKKSTEKATPAQVAWVHRAKQLASCVRAEKFSRESFAIALKKLKELRKNAEDIRDVARILADGGIRLILIEGLPKGKIDGATFWLDEYSPVVVLSIRYDRLDYFWFALMHELGHVANRDALELPILDVNLVGDDTTAFEDKSEIEKRADQFAEGFLVENVEIEKFIRRYSPLYSKQKIKNFSARVGVHPAIVLGQLQHRQEVDWTHSREMLVKVRDIAIAGTLTDGWGHQPPAM